MSKVYKKRSKKPTPQTLKKPMNAFMLFKTQNQDEIRKSHPSLSSRDLAKVIGEIWKKMSLIDKTPYRNQSFVLTQLYQWQKSLETQSDTDIGSEQMDEISTFLGSLEGASGMHLPVDISFTDFFQSNLPTVEDSCFTEPITDLKPRKPQCNLKLDIPKDVSMELSALSAKLKCFVSGWTPSSLTPGVGTFWN